MSALRRQFALNSSHPLILAGSVSVKGTRLVVPEIFHKQRKSHSVSEWIQRRRPQMGSESSFNSSASAISFQPSCSISKMGRQPVSENEFFSLLREYQQVQSQIELAQRTIRNLAAMFREHK